MPVSSAAKIALDCPAVIRMAQVSLCDELLNLQQETNTSFLELLEKEISQNSQHTQSLIDQHSSDVQRSIQVQVEELIEKENENASKLKVVEEL